MAVRRVETIVPTAYRELSETEINDFVSAFDKKDKNRAEKLLHALKRAGIQIDESGAVVFNDGSTGSSIFALVSYFTKKSNGEEEQPLDAEKFLHYIKKIGVDILLITPTKRRL